MEIFPYPHSEFTSSSRIRREFHEGLRLAAKFALSENRAVLYLGRKFKCSHESETVRGGRVQIQSIQVFLD